ncbi:MAG: AAA family ATPase [Clostridia bacterium]|nr:AAA family ATPase [Clostridia bacterium]
MSEIRKVIVENFQSHEYTELDFDKGLNVIVGPSDQGKSALIRAIKWVLYNEPRGFEFIRHGTAVARVTLEMDAGFKIIRERSKSKNRYIVINPDGEEAIYEGFGNEIPKEVINAHGIPKVILDADISSSLNIGDQLEGPFLLSETGSVRAKAIGRLTGIHIIDNAVRDSMTDLRRENQNLDRVNNEIESINLKLEDYKGLENIKERLSTAENIIGKLDLKTNRLKILDRDVEILKSTNNEVERINTVLVKLRNLKESEEKLKNCSSLVLRLQKANKFYNELKTLEEQMEKVRFTIKQTDNYEECQNIIKSAEGIKVKYDNIKRHNHSLRQLYNEEKTAARIIKDTEEVENLRYKLSSGEKMIENYKKFVNASDKLKNYKAEILRIERHAIGTEKFNEYTDITDKLGNNMEKLRKLNEINERNNVINNFISEGLKYIQNNTQQISKYAKEYAQLLRKAGKCPMCGNEIGEMKVNEIIKHYEEAH